MNKTKEFDPVVVRRYNSAAIMVVSIHWVIIVCRVHGDLSMCMVMVVHHVI